MKENILREKSFAFAVRIVGLYKHLKSINSEMILAKQLLRSGTSIAANIREAEYAESLKDFVHKLSVSLKESNETKYWLEFMYETKFIESKFYDSFISDVNELIKLLIASINTSKKKYLSNSTQ